MAEKPGPEAGAFARSFDQPRQISEHEFGLVVDPHDAELRMQGRERIVGDFRLGVRQARQQRRFPGIRQPDQTGIGDQLEAQPHPEFASGPTRTGAARRLIRRALVMRVAETAITAAQQHDTLTRFGQVGEHGFLVVVEHLRPDRDAQHEVAPVRAGTVRPGPAAAVLGPEVLAVAIVDQSVQIVRGLEDDVAALATVATVRPAKLDELLAAKTHCAAAAIATFQVDFALVQEFHWIAGDLPNRIQTKRGAADRSPSESVASGSVYSAASAGSGTTEMNLRPPIPSWNFTWPASSANSVWSRPIPTRSPGWNLVPRCRTIMLPGTTISPPNFLTPSRRPGLSRPLRDEPPAFLCAISTLLPTPSSLRGAKRQSNLVHRVQSYRDCFAAFILGPKGRTRGLAMT